MTTTGQNTQQLILNAASQLTAEQFDTYQRLCKRLLHGPKFQLLLLDCRDERLQQQLQALLVEVCQQANLAVTSLKTDEQLADVFVLQQQLITLSSNYSVIQLTGAASWFATAGRWAELNLLRENIASQAPCRLLFWLDAESIAGMIDQAPDWWAWRSGVYTFENQHTDALTSVEQQEKIHQRIAVLTQWLRPSSDLELALPLWFELVTLYQQLDDPVSVGVSHCQIADLLFANGDFAKALDHYQLAIAPEGLKLQNQQTILHVQQRIIEIQQSMIGNSAARHIKSC